MCRYTLILGLLCAKGCAHCKTEVVVTYHHEDADIAVRLSR